MCKLVALYIYYIKNILIRSNIATNDQQKKLIKHVHQYYKRDNNKLKVSLKFTMKGKLS